jgi:hypothetical protein
MEPVPDEMSNFELFDDKLREHAQNFDGPILPGKKYLIKMCHAVYFRVD